MVRIMVATALACLLTTAVLIQRVQSRAEVDVSWDFDDQEVTSGWANATAEENHMIVKASSGELRCIITDFSPKLDSPNMVLDVTHRHFIVMRAKYEGIATSARLLLRSGSRQSPDKQLVFGTAHWSARLPMTVIDSSAPISDNFTWPNLVDGNPETYYFTNSSAGVFFVFDLGDQRSISSIRIFSLGNKDSPKRCVLQRSITSGVGPFQAVVSFTLSQNGTEARSTVAADASSSVQITEQQISGFEGYSRYWRLVVLENHGGSGVGIREVALDGYDERVTVVPFALSSTSSSSTTSQTGLQQPAQQQRYHTYYLPVNSYLAGVLLRMRFELVYPDNVRLQPYMKARLFREKLSIDYIRVVRAPETWRVRGCLDKYYVDPSYQNPVYNVTTVEEVINGNLPIHSFIKHSMDLPYATTYDCPVDGGFDIVVEGINYGTNPEVFVDGERCPVTSNTVSPVNGRYHTLVCTLPAMRADCTETETTTAAVSACSALNKVVRVQNGVLPELFHEVPSLSYRVAPPVPDRPIVTNIAAQRVDLVWTAPGNEFEQMTITGYKILWFQPQFSTRISNVTVSNITTTSIRGLEPGTEYVFAIAAMAEGSVSALLPTDLYGRRAPVDTQTNENTAISAPAAISAITEYYAGIPSLSSSPLITVRGAATAKLGTPMGPSAMIGTFSTFTNITATIVFDFDFSFFSANATLNSSGSSASKSLGPTGQFGSEGNFGLVLVGSANVQNCNVSSTCCDGYNATIGPSSCGILPTVCAVLPAQMLAFDFVLGGVTRRGVPTNLPYSNGAPAEIQIITLAELIANKGADLPSSACGPALRLTPSGARHSGAGWYRRKLDVREGFDTYIEFQISNPSQKCDRQDDVNTYCRSRGADGLAFVIQNVAPDALGDAGSGMGYQGIFNALSVELDTYHNFDQMDAYENHVSVMTEGFRFNITANHSRALATSNRVPDLTDGKHTIRIRYDPNFDENAVPHPSFQVNGFTTWFLNNADFQYGGEGDWGTGFGLLYVYVDDMYSPIITTPLNLGATLQLDNGRAYVGITAATGDEYWQAHDVLSWQFRSLHIDEKYTPPARVNQQGDYRCANETACVHPVDYDHYMRRNNLWGKGSDSTEGWQAGTEGFCAFC